jgi:hypothetical protein
MTPEELQQRAEVVAHVIRARAKLQLIRDRAGQLVGPLGRRTLESVAAGRICRATPQPAPAMHQLLVLTVDPDQTTIDSTIVVTHADGTSQTFHYVDVIDGLLHYRNDALSEEDARRLIA